MASRQTKSSAKNTKQHIDSFVVVNKSKTIAKDMVNDIINSMFCSVGICGSILDELVDGVHRGLERCWNSIIKCV